MDPPTDWNARNNFVRPRSPAFVTLPASFHNIQTAHPGNTRSPDPARLVDWFPHRARFGPSLLPAAVANRLPANRDGIAEPSAYASQPRALPQFSPRAAESTASHMP